MGENNLINKDSLTAMATAAGSDEGTSAFDWFSASEAEKEERRKLVATMNRLISRLE